MRAITLFSGIGGFELGFERAGIEVDSMCEIDKNAQKILTRRFPKTKLYDDVRKVGNKTHEKGTIDIIAGGFPCQDLSIAGKRKGLDGERSGLWFEFARVIDELEPKWVEIENVVGLLSSAGGRDFAVILQWLAQRGYCVAWRVLDAQYFGVAQRRRRVFVVASFGNGRAAEVLFERESLSGNTPPSREAGKEIADTFTIRSGKDGGGKGYLGQASLAMTLGGQQQYLAKTITTRETQSLDSETMNFIIPPVGVRRLTPLECERLQGFPDGWTDGQSDSVRYKQLGNAVAVPVVEWIARRIEGLDKTE